MKLGQNEQLIRSHIQMFQFVHRNGYKSKLKIYGIIILMACNLIVINITLIRNELKMEDNKINSTICQSWKDHGFPSGYYVKEHLFHNLSM